MEPFIGEIRIFAGNYAPMGWAFCTGQVLNISQFQALYAVIGNTYGGNPPNTFALPDLRGRAPMHWGQGQGLTYRVQGQAGGNAGVTLLASEMPSHTHRAQGTSVAATSSSPANGIWAKSTGTNLYGTNTPNTPLNGLALQGVGGSQPHNNMQPYLGIYFIMALEGIFPSRP